MASRVTCVRHGELVEVAADRVVISAGALGSTEVLLRSDLDRDGLVGQGLHCLGGLFVAAETDQIRDGFDGIGLVCVAKASSEYVIESYFAPPMVFSMSVGGYFLTHFNRMQRYRYFAEAGVMVGTSPRGRIWLDRKRVVRFNLEFSEGELAALKRGTRKLAEIFFAGGAIRVLPSTFNLIEFTRREDIDILDERVNKPEDLMLGSAHPQGGNIMHEDPSHGVVDNEFRLHGSKNIYVADSSVFPTNIWANCQATVMAMSHYASSFVAK
jgi:choline dehydrogenase-like flavoprotein